MMGSPDRFKAFWGTWGRTLANTAGSRCLQAVRERAAAYLASAVIPTSRDEDWRYTDLRVLSGLDWALGDGGVAVLPSAIDQIVRPSDINIVIVNGVWDARATVSDLPGGISILSGDSALAALPPDAFDVMTGNDSQLFLRLNDLYFRDLLLVDIASGVDLLRPVHIVHVWDEGSPAKAIFPRIFIRLAEGSGAKLFESSIVLHERPVLVNAVMDIRLAAGATLEVVQACSNNSSMARFMSTRVIQQKDSRMDSFLFTDGARIFRHNLSLLLEGEGAEASANGLHKLKDDRHADSHTFVDHLAPHTRSTQLYKSILDGSSRSVFNGRIRVSREAQLTNSYQLNKNLILSRESRVDTKPQLEIFADDVKCSHGATIGQLDEDQLFYLGTRGIGKDDAAAMLIRGFVDDVVDRVQDITLRDKLIQIVG